MPESKTEFVGQLQRPGQRPENVSFFAQKRPDLTIGERAAGLEWVDSRYDPGDIRRYGTNTTPGTTDMSVAIRNAIAANGIVNFQRESYLVSQDASNAWCIRNTASNRIINGNGATLVNTDGALQIFRNTGTANVHVRDLNVQGPNTNGSNLSAALFQFNDCDDFSLVNVRSLNSDQDGIAVSSCSNGYVFGCKSENDSKAGIYVNNSTDVLVAGNISIDSGGHTVSGNVVGAGIQLSGNTRVECKHNKVEGATGYGILCNDNGGNHPESNIIDSNVIINCRNATNGNVSSGIRCVNADATTVTGTRISNNYIRDVGWYGIYVENHGGFRCINNTVIETDRDGVVIATLTGGVVSGNDIWNSDTDAGGSRYSLQLINACDEVTVMDNFYCDSSAFAAASASLTTNDASSGTNSIKKKLLRTGLATVANGTTSIAVAHGLPYTPNQQNIQVNPVESWGSATEFWHDGIGATNFSVSVDADPGKDLDFIYHIYGEAFFAS